MSIMKKFTVTGLCVPEDNYMCDTTEKFNRCKYLSENGYYYAINFPRQFGKTTMQYLLDMEFNKNKEHHSSKDNSFLEKNGRLLLMSFLRPIINGRGFMFKENVTTEDRKMDLVVTFNDKRYVIELKIWYGKKYLTDGLKQLANYLDSYSLDTGYMLIYNFNKNKRYETQRINKYDKNITAVFV